MPSSSPGPPPLPGEAGEPSVAPSREDRLFLEVQAEISDWTRPQPGEDAAAAGRRRSRVKDLMRMAVAHLESGLSCLAKMREAGRSMEVSRLPAFRVEVMAARDHCQAWWSLLLKLFKQAEGERSFGREMMERLQQARACGMGSPVNPPTPGPSPPAPGPSPPEEKVVDASVSVAQEGSKPVEETKAPQDPEKLKGAAKLPVVRIPRLDGGVEGRTRETTARRAGLRSNPGTEKLTPLGGTGPKGGSTEKKGVGGAPTKGGGGTPGAAGRGVARGRGQGTAGTPGKSSAGASSATSAVRGVGGEVGIRGGNMAARGGAGSSKAGGAAGGEGVGKSGVAGASKVAPAVKTIDPLSENKQKGEEPKNGGDRSGAAEGKPRAFAEVTGGECAKQNMVPGGKQVALEVPGESLAAALCSTGSRTGSEVIAPGSDDLESLVSPQSISSTKGAALEDFRVGGVHFGREVEGESGEGAGSDPMSPQNSMEWGDSTDGGAGGCSQDILEVIRKMEEGSQQGMDPSQSGSGGELQGVVGGGEGGPKVEWDRICDTLMGGSLLSGLGVTPAEGSRVPEVNKVVGVQEGGGESKIQVLGPEVRDPTISQEKAIQSALVEGRSYANVAGARVSMSHAYQTFGAQNLANPPGEGQQGWARGGGGPERKRRNVIQLRWGGTGQCPCRREVVDSLLGMGFKVEDIFAVIHPHNSREYDVSFTTPVLMELFITKYQLTGGAVRWKDFVVVPLSRQEEVKTVTVLVRNESIPAEDIRTWLGRYGQVEGTVNKGRDERGIWTGAWTVRMRLSRRGASVAHIPASAFIGRDRILVFYPGQPHLCFRCGSPTHLSRDCLTPSCVKCGAGGHTASQCREIRCNLCGEMGHPFSRCPKAYREGVGAVQVAQQQVGVDQGQVSQGVQQGQSLVVEAVERGEAQGGKAKEKRDRQVRRSERRGGKEKADGEGVEGGVEPEGGGGVGVQPQEERPKVVEGAPGQVEEPPASDLSLGGDEARPVVKARRVGGSRPPEVEGMEESGAVAEGEGEIQQPRRKKKATKEGDQAGPVNVDSAGDSADEKEGWLKKEKKRKRARNKGRHVGQEDEGKQDALSSAMETETEGEDEGALGEDVETEELESEVEEEEAGASGAACSVSQ